MKPKYCDFDKQSLPDCVLFGIAMEYAVSIKHELNCLKTEGI